MDLSEGIEPVRCCTRPDINIFDGGSRVCLSCGASNLTVSALLFDSEPTRTQYAVQGAEAEFEIELGSRRRPRAPYSHNDLTDERQMRLLRIFPGSFFDPIKCGIIHENLDSPPDYDAISYTWANAEGDSTPCAVVNVFCDGRYHHAQVTTNCEAALRRLRLQGKERLVFVDALCINQSNLKERGHQVRLMPEIYSHARRVIIYVGEPTDGSDKVMAKVDQFGVVPPPNVGFNDIDKGVFRGWILSFLSRAWFQRVWVLQEVGMAKQAIVVCGSQSVQWERFIITGLDRPGNNAFAYADPCPPVLRLSLNGQQPLRNIYRLLSDARSCSSSDPRDKIYAVYGLLEDSASAGLLADYSKSAETVFTEITEFLIKNYNTLDILGLVESRHRRVGMPSWVADWTVPLQINPLASVPSWSPSPRADAYYFALGHHGKRILCTKGYILGTVSFFWHNIKKHLATRLHTLFSTYSNSQLLEASDNSGPNDDGFNPLQRIFSEWNISDYFDSKALWSLNRTPSRVEEMSSFSVKTTGDIVAKWVEFHAEETGSGRKLFLTREGHVGFGPPLLQAGDVLCKLRNTSVAHFLREDSEYYSYVGECFGGFRREDLGFLLVDNLGVEGLPTTGRGAAEQDIAIW